MNYKILKQHNFQTNLWSGGTTTELFIYPATAKYQEGYFDFRLSTATVEVEKSDFTLLQNVSRKLMILDGNIIIHHEGKPQKRLNKFDVDEFLGDWKTSSEGTCTDFNLMTKGNINGNIKALTIETNISINYSIIQEATWVFIYAYSGTISFNIQKEKLTIHKGDLLTIQTPDISILTINCIESAELIFTEIFV